MDYDPVGHYYEAVGEQPSIMSGDAHRAIFHLGHEKMVSIA